MGSHLPLAFVARTSFSRFCSVFTTAHTPAVLEARGDAGVPRHFQRDAGVFRAGPFQRHDVFEPCGDKSRLPRDIQYMIGNVLLAIRKDNPIPVSKLEKNAKNFRKEYRLSVTTCTKEDANCASTWAHKLKPLI